jgi:hypothetical protein
MLSKIDVKDFFEINNVLYGTGQSDEAMRDYMIAVVRRLIEVEETRQRAFAKESPRPGRRGH